MILPFETCYSFWLEGVSRYAWEPAPPPPPPLDGASLEVTEVDPSTPPACSGDALPPALRLVFKGTEWVAYRVTWARPNPGWELTAQLQRDNMESRAEEQERERERAAKPPVPRPPALPGATDQPIAAGGGKPVAGDQ